VIWSVSVDLDGLGCYAAIHGLPLRLDDRSLRAVPELAVQRFCDLFSSLGVRGTFFVIGREASIAPGTLRAAAAAGHEIASHSYAHDYALSRKTREEIAQDLALAERAIEDASGRGRGASAPPDTRSRPRCSTRCVTGATPPRFPQLLPARPTTRSRRRLLTYALRGRKSQVSSAAWANLFAPAARTGGARCRSFRWRLPGARPVIRTTVLPLPWLARGAAAGGLVNLELHGIDALDRTDVPEIAAAGQVADAGL
jgi:peptidoglycan/xylan/chitin deacetylase (PgdA/CDA1 family)